MNRTPVNDRRSYLAPIEEESNETHAKHEHNASEKVRSQSSEVVLGLHGEEGEADKDESGDQEGFKHDCCVEVAHS